MNAHNVIKIAKVFPFLNNLYFIGKEGDEGGGGGGKGGREKGSGWWGRVGGRGEGRSKGDDDTY